MPLRFLFLVDIAYFERQSNFAGECFSSNVIIWFVTSVSLFFGG